VSQRTTRVRWAAATRTFQALDLVMDIRTTDPHLATFLDHAYSTLPEADPADPARVRFGLACVPGGGTEADRYRLYRRDRFVREVAGPSFALSRLLSLVNAAVVRATSRRRLLLHAGLVGDAGGSVLLAGRSMSGKSTLSALLASQGVCYVTDEMVAIDPATGAIDGFRRPLILRPAGLMALEGRVPPPPRGLRAYLEVSRPVAAVDLGATSLDPVPPVRAVVLPEFGILGPASWDPLTRAETLARLQRGTWHLLAHGRLGFRTLVDLVARAERFGVLRYSDAGDGAALIRETADLAVRG
jgi:hypothetical protein